MTDETKPVGEAARLDDREHEVVEPEPEPLVPLEERRTRHAQQRKVDDEGKPAGFEKK